MLRNLWAYRHLVTSLVRRDFELRSARSLWGHAWLVIQPAIQVAIYMVIFAEVLRAKLPGAQDPMAYALHVTAGLVSWNYMAEIVQRSQSLFLDHANLLKTIQFPRSTLPVVVLFSATINFALIGSVFVIALVISGHWPGWLMVAALPLLVVQALLAIALGVLTGTVNVFFRDVGQAVTVALQFWFWLTPIVYPLAILPERLQNALAWNPMLHVVGGYQRIVVEGIPPTWTPVGAVAATGLVLGVLAWWTFRTLSPDLVDEL